MRFSLVATLLFSTAVVNAKNFLVKVGANAQLIFDPDQITAAAGDTVSFQFQGKNHSVTQSTFASPCVRQTTPTLGIDSGFMPVPSGAASLPEWTITVNNGSAPLWFFCAQTKPIVHCQQGMVFAINAPPTKTFAQFQAAAKAGGSSSGSGAAPPASSASAAAGYGAPGAPPPTTDSGSNSDSSSQTDSSSLPSATDSSAPATSTSTVKSNAGRLGGSAAGALTVAALLGAFVL
jgi:hypothetical protein